MSIDSLGDIHTVVFDLDDTLYPERDFVLSGFEAVGDWLQANKQVSGFAPLARRHFEAGHRGRNFDAVLLQLGITPDPRLLVEMVAVYRGHSPAIHLPPESAAFLDWARPRFQLALISDGFHEVQERKFRSLALERWVNVAIYPDTRGREYWKPHLWAFTEVMRQIPGTAGGYVYVGDNPAKDFIGARAAGWKTVRLRSPGREHSGVEAEREFAPDHEVADLTFLQRLLGDRQGRSVSVIPSDEGPRGSAGPG